MRGQWRSVMVVQNESEGFEDGVKAPLRIPRWRSIARLRELLEMTRELTLMPRNEDLFDVGKVFVQRRAADTGRFRNLRHRHSS